VENLIAGLLALAVAGGFFYILLSHLPSTPLWIVVLLGAVLMVLSFIETLRQGGGGGA
jgi:hypothetical protein